jgi:hypothetical protein
VSGKGMPERVAGGMLRDAGLAHPGLDGSLDEGLIDMMADMVEEVEALAPVAVGLFGARAVVAGAQSRGEEVDEFMRAGGGWQATAGGPPPDRWRALARIGSGALSLADRMEPPSVVPGRCTGSEATPDAARVSSGRANGKERRPQGHVCAAALPASLCFQSALSATLWLTGVVTAQMPIVEKQGLARWIAARLWLRTGRDMVVEIAAPLPVNQ